MVNEDHLGREVQKYLEQVTISRVFDLEGLREVLSEVTLDFQPQLGHEDGKAPTTDLLVRSATPPPHSLHMNEGPAIVPEVMDSEDEDTTPDDKAVHQGEEEGIQILIVDSMTDIINELFARKEKAQGILHYPKLQFLTVDAQEHTIYLAASRPSSATYPHTPTSLQFCTTLLSHPNPSIPRLLSTHNFRLDISRCVRA